MRLFAATLSIASVLAAPASYLYTGAATRSTERRVAVTISAAVGEAAEENGGAPLRVWFPVPRESRWQTLEEWNPPAGFETRIVVDSTYGNRFLAVEAPVQDGPTLTVEVSYVVTRRAIPRYQGETEKGFGLFSGSGSGEKVAAAHSAPLSLYLLPRRLIPLDGPIALEAGQVAGNIDDPLEKAKRLFDHVVETMCYDKSGSGWGRGDALYACTARAGNCTDFHSLFIGEARALGLPARFIMGLPLPEDRAEGEIPGYHCWGEFYVQGNGWLPVDASEASKHVERKDSYFATLDADRVAFTLGRDIIVPGTNHAPFNYFIYPYVEVGGKPYDRTKTRFYFEDLAR